MSSRPTPKPRPPSKSSTTDGPKALRKQRLTSFTAKGTFQGYDEPTKSPLDIFAKSPNQRTTIIHKKAGDTTTVYDGRQAWSAAPATEVPVTLLPSNRFRLDAQKVDAELSFPRQHQRYVHHVAA